MPIYEYKFVQFPKLTGINYSKKVSELEIMWNELGKHGWKFCKDGLDYVVFMREKINDQESS